MANFKPTPDHWAAFADAVIKARAFDEFLGLAAQQSLFQFANFLPIMDVDGSSQPAKENAVFNLIYINMVRMVFAQMIDNTQQPILSLDFFNAMAQIDTDEEMDTFVQEVFIPIIRSPKTLGRHLPKFNGSYDAISNLMKFLYTQVRLFRVTLVTIKNIFRVTLVTIKSFFPFILSHQY